MNPKITPDHLGRTAIVYVRQSTIAQVVGNLESPSASNTIWPGLLARRASRR